MDGPPPPPPHGEKPNTTHGEYRRASDLPEGNYDIFVIPPHSSGSGFLYLPSLQCHRNSFIAGSLSTLFAVLLWFTLAPVLKTWYATTIASGSGMGIALLAIGVGVAGWAFGASQTDNGSQRGPGFGGSGPGAGGAGSQNHSSRTGANYSKGSNFGGTNSGQNYGGNFGGGTHQGGQYGNQRAGGPPPNQGKNPGAEWDRAREETRRKEEIRRKMEEFKRKREADAKEKEKQRGREAMERERREREKQLEKDIAEAKAAGAKEAKEKADKEAAESRERKEKEAAETKAKADKEAAEKDAEAKANAKKEADAKFAALKEAAAKKYAEKKAKDAQGTAGTGGSNTARTPSPKKPPFPTARTATDDDDAYSFRPYDRPRRPYGGASGSSMYSESSYAASQSTAPTTPPASHRGAYSTKDPDKIVIRGVYAFNNAFLKNPIAQLVSGQGMVTDGLVLRITTEGLFIDDDIRGVPQREWDVKAWTMKLAEVWCPQLGANQPRQNPPKANPFRWGSSQSTPTPEESDNCLANLLKVCKNTCRLASPACFSRNGGGVGGANAEQRGLHVLRASLRDQEGKRYIFVLQETEGWKVAIGLQRLRRGTQVRALGVSNMPMNDSRTVLGNLGYV